MERVLADQRLQDGTYKNLITSGFDARHYQKVHRQITWCNRLAGGNSLGTDRLIVLFRRCG